MRDKGGNGGFDPSAILSEIEEFKRSKTQPVRDQIAKLEGDRDEIEGQIEELRRLLDKLEGREPGRASGRGKGGGGDLTGADLAAKGADAIKFLRSRAGEWIKGGEIGKAIGYGKVAEAISAATDGEDVERKGQGRNREYKVKG